MNAPPLPKLSIVVPSYNQAAYLEQTLNSILCQGYPELELIVLDGGSTDGSLEILRRYDQRLTHWVSQPDRGQTDAINRGFALCTGDIVAWLNSDDLYLAGSLEHAARALLDHPQAGMVYADGVMVDSDGMVLDPHHYRPLSVLDLLCFNVILQPTVFMRRHALAAVGPLDEAYNLIMDHDLWVRLAARFPIVHVAEPWAVERTHPEAKTVAQAGAFVQEAERLIRQAALDPLLGPLWARQRRLIAASLEAFAARRLIDGGEYAEATRRFWRSARHDPRVPLRYWYKVLQAGLSALGLSGAFHTYRRSRRRMQHGQAQVVLGEKGAIITRTPPAARAGGERA
jgi:glycosyltransferase involved in cell wall biosynthesis